MCIRSDVIIEVGGREGIAVAVAPMVIGFIMAILGTLYLWWGPDSTILVSGVIGGTGVILMITSMVIPRHK